MRTQAESGLTSGVEPAGLVRRSTATNFKTRCIEAQAELEKQDSQKKELHFPTMDATLVWIRAHKGEVAVGTIVIVAGVIAAPFVVAIAAGGALVLAPL